MDTKGLCKYCYASFDNSKHKRTREHIIPKGIIDLYPNEYITFDGRNRFINNEGTTIGDVCSFCNNSLLSVLDAYGKDLIQSQFYNKILYEEKDVLHARQLDYNILSRWLLKIYYNHLRSKKSNSNWFNKVLGYILHGFLVEHFTFSLFAGIHINTSPLPEGYVSNYVPMQICDNPKLIGNSMGIFAFGIDPFINSVIVPKCNNTFCIRMGTAVFYCILWMNDVSLEIKKTFEKLLTHEFNFVKIKSNQQDYMLKCVSAHSNEVMGYTHLVSSSGQEKDEKIVQSYIGGREPHETQQLMSDIRSVNDIEESRIFVEHAMFPKNKKIQKKFDAIVSKGNP